MIVGRRLRIRRPEADDHAIIYNWRNDPVNKPFFTEEEPVSLDSHLAWYERIRQSPSDRFYVIDAFVTPDFKPLPSPLLIGTTGFRLIDWRNRTAEYLWLLLKSEYRHKGFGKEAEFFLMSYAFEHLNLNKIWLYIFPDNLPARKLHEWTGFKDEGLLRQQVFKGGRYVDLLRIGLLAEEFRARELKLREEVWMA